MQKFSVVVFDLGNVLIPFDYSIMISRLNSVRPGLGEQFMEYYKDNYEVHRSFERGDISNSEFIDIMLKQCDDLIDGETFCRFYSEIFRVNKEVTELLPLLKEKGYKLVLLSNTNDIHREYGYKRYEFLNYFDKLILSHEVRAVKPEPAIYKAVETYTGCPASEHIFIDDVQEYVEGARQMGWDAIRFIDSELLKSELSRKGIL